MAKSKKDPAPAPTSTVMGLDKEQTATLEDISLAMEIAKEVFPGSASGYPAAVFGCCDRVFCYSEVEDQQKAVDRLKLSAKIVAEKFPEAIVQASTFYQDAVFGVYDRVFFEDEDEDEEDGE